MKITGFRIVATLAVLIVLLFDSSCIEQSNRVESQAAVPKQKAAPIVFIGIDGSGSYDYYDAGKMKLKKLIGFLPAGSKVYVRWITSDSYNDKNSIITQQLPEMIEDGGNAFNKRNRIKQLRAKLDIKKGKEKIWTQILKAEYPRSKFTDLYGFFLIVSEKISRAKAEGKENPAYLIILSDLRHNQKKYEKSVQKESLPGTRVILLAFKSTTHELKVKWSKIFTDFFGAERPYFLTIDEEAFDIFSKSSPGIDEQKESH